MTKKSYLLFLSAIALLLLSSCINGYSTDALHGETECMTEERNIVNQAYFGEFINDIYNNQPIGPSGEVILARYFGGMYFNNESVLTVQVLEAAFAHAASATAIEEMRALGILISTVEFAHQDIMATIDALNNAFESARELGATSWWSCAKNRVTVGLDPYTDEQKALFTAFLYEHSINPAMIIIQQAVTPEMRDARAASIATAIQSPGGKIVLVGEVEVSRTGIAFSLENRTDLQFNYGAPWDLAYYTNGHWTPVEHLPGAGSGYWLAWGASLQSGGIDRYRQEWTYRFGELPPGRYMFIRDGWLGEWNPDQDRVYATFEFFITADCPVSLSPQPETHYWPAPIILVEFGDVTPTGMTMVVQNQSAYDIDHRVQILFIVPERYAVSDDWWEWQQHSLPFLPVEGYWIDHLMQGEGFLPSGRQLEFALDWTTVFGELAPGEYVIALSLGGRAFPPHPTGFILSDTLLVAFVVE